MRLTVEDLFVLLTELNLPRSLKDRLMSLPVLVADLSEQDVDALRDLVGVELQRSGFDEDYKANELGVKLERLVDKLFVR